MELGCFSVSLAVKDIKVSQKFYETLGFKLYAGDPAQNWVILKNGTTNIGLFQGMFPNNIMTFNPGWDGNAQPLENPLDIREIQAALKSHGVQIEQEIEEGSKGPANFMVTDPDGNTVLFDQHV